mmetsp:Transcript_28513/g.57515  ORF Transcript_28513/g.57515 Transcript_28513/m.57515 type:complete len:252 (-) Transcript_28513:84-839(-)
MMSQQPTAPAYSMQGKARESCTVGRDAPAAGMPNFDLYLPCAPSFSMGGRAAGETEEETPGPGSFSLDHLPKAPAFSMGARPVTPILQAGATPAAQPVGDAHLPAAPAYSMSGRGTEGHTHSVGPAPNEYEHQQPWLQAHHPKAPAFSLGRLCKQASVRTGEYTAYHITRTGKQDIGYATAALNVRHLRPGSTHGAERAPRKGPHQHAHQGARKPNPAWVRPAGPTMHTTLPSGSSWRDHVTKAASYLQAA